MAGSPTIDLIGVNDVAKSRRVTAAWLAAGEPLAIDAEGLSLGATGRLTLLQVATRDGTVTLFDVINPRSFEDTVEGKRLLVDGGMKTLLESTQLLKIVHGCQRDYGALFYQFDITVRNVFDTQAANLAIEHAKGTQFPDMLKLEVLAKNYAGIELDSKDFKEEWLKDEWMFWGRRPLSARAMEYAAGDVAILHSLYDVMQREIDKVEECQESYQIFLDIEKNEQIEESRISRKADTFRKQRMLNVFREVSKKTTPGGMLSDDEKGAIRAFRKLLANGVVQETDLPRHMQELEGSLVREFENDLVAYQSGEKTDYDDIDWRPIKAMKNHPNSDLNDRVKKASLQLKLLKARFKIKELTIRINQGDVRGLKVLKASDFATVNMYREFQEDLANDPNIDSMIITLEHDLSRKELSQLEELQSTGKLAHVVTFTMHAKLRDLCRHTDHDIKKRAQSLSKDVNIYKTKNELKMLMRKYSTHLVSFSTLSENEKWIIRRYRQYKESMSTEDQNEKIRALELELNREDLDRFEQWQRDGQLSARAGKETKIIRELTEHEDPAVRARALVLDQALRQQRRGARGRHRGGSGRARGRRW